MGNTIAAVFLCLSAVSVKGFLSAWLLSALFLQLFKPVSKALPFGRFGRSAFFLDLSLPLGKAAVVLFYNGFGFSVGCHKCLHIEITVLFQKMLYAWKEQSDKLSSEEISKDKYDEWRYH